MRVTVAVAVAVGAAVFAAAAAAAADFRACVERVGVEVLGGGDAGFDSKVSRALYPSPTPKWYVDVDAASQVEGVLSCAVDEGLGVCPRSGGHSFVGGSSCDGVVLDVHKMKDISLRDGGKEAVVGAGNTLGEMFFGVLQQSDGERMVGIGLCPSVGVGGYMLGGGHNPYSGRLGLTCESVREYVFVTPAGETLMANKEENKELFWASCGGGGAHFGVLTQFTIATYDAAPYHRNVFFRYKWPIAQAGSVLSKWLDYDQDDGDTWFRLEINNKSPIYGYGVCWDVDSVGECEDRLGKADFFNVKGRSVEVVLKGADVADFQRFIGPAGRWGWERSTQSEEEAFTGDAVQWDEAGKGLNRHYSGAYWGLEAKPPVAMLQAMAEICHDVDTTAVAFTNCQWNPWKGKQRSGGGKHAFAHREFDVLTELIGEGSDDSGVGIAEVKRMEAEIKGLTGVYVGGIYVNYPEFGLAKNDYQYLYWGQSLPRLAALRAEMDPDGTLTQLQPLPNGALTCPGAMSVTGKAPTLSLGIDAYAGGQQPGMRLYFSMPSGCGVKATSGGSVSEAAASGVDGTAYVAIFSSVKPIVVYVDGTDDCAPDIVAINGVVCADGVTLDANKALSGGVEDSGEEVENMADGDSDRDGDDEVKSGGRCFPANATIETRDRGVVRMDELAIGDEVRVAGDAFSPVFFFSHASPAVSTADFVSVTATAPSSCGAARTDYDVSSCAAARTATVILTAGHYLPLATGRGLKAASALLAGDALADGLVVSLVARVGRRAGLYNPHTLAGTVVVDGVVASCYTTAVHPRLAVVVMAPLAAAWRATRVVPGLVAALDIVCSGLSKALDVARPRLARALGGPSVT